MNDKKEVSKQSLTAVVLVWYISTSHVHDEKRRLEKDILEVEC